MQGTFLWAIPGGLLVAVMPNCLVRMISTLTDTVVWKINLNHLVFSSTLSDQDHNAILMQPSSQASISIIMLKVEVTGNMMLYVSLKMSFQFLIDANNIIILRFYIMWLHVQDLLFKRNMTFFLFLCFFFNSNNITDLHNNSNMYIRQVFTAAIY